MKILFLIQSNYINGTGLTSYGLDLPTIKRGSSFLQKPTLNLNTGISINRKY
jgi:hypothetical protein